MNRPAPFRFKQFVVHHDRCAMPVGTDAVLLGAWTDVAGKNSILDIGTGSGVIALMLAQRTASHVAIDAVEVGQPDCEQALANVLASPWPTKVTVHQSAIQEFDADRRYDLIVCNPPYFVGSLKPPSDSRTRARHDSSLSHADLVSAAIAHLSPSGSLSVIFPTTEGREFRESAERVGLHCIRDLAFYTRSGKTRERSLMELQFKIQPVKSESLTLYSSGLEWSDEYKNLTRDFYLVL